MGKKTLLIIVGAIVALALVGGAGYLFFLKDPPLVISIGNPASGMVAAEGAPSATPAPTAAPAVRYPEPGDGIMFDLGTRIVNLLDPVGRLYLKIGIVVEFLPPDYTYYQMTEEERTVAKEAFLADLAEAKPIIDDLIITVLTGKTYEDVYSPEGKNLLRAELTDRLNERLAGRYQAMNLYFTDFIIQ